MTVSTTPTTLTPPKVYWESRGEALNYEWEWRETFAWEVGQRTFCPKMVEILTILSAFEDVDLAYRLLVLITDGPIDSLDVVAKVCEALRSMPATPEREDAVEAKLAQIIARAFPDRGPNDPRIEDRRIITDLAQVAQLQARENELAHAFFKRHGQWKEETQQAQNGPGQP